MPVGIFLAYKFLQLAEYLGFLGPGLQSFGNLLQMLISIVSTSSFFDKNPERHREEPFSIFPRSSSSGHVILSI
jgi:hypothetical protein